MRSTRNPQIVRQFQRSLGRSVEDADVGGRAPGSPPSRARTLIGDLLTSDQPLASFFRDDERGVRAARDHAAIRQSLPLAFVELMHNDNIRSHEEHFRRGLAEEARLPIGGVGVAIWSNRTFKPLTRKCSADNCLVKGSYDLERHRRRSVAPHELL